MDTQDINEVIMALKLALEYFEHRDQMNAAVHKDLCRWSPITERIRDAKAILEQHEENT